MSTGTRFLSPKVYAVARFIVVFWALGNLVAFAIFWGSAALDIDQPDWLQVSFGEVDITGPLAAVLFTLQALLQALLVVALWHGVKALRRLEHPVEGYCDLILHLARFATALFVYSIGATFVSVVQASLAAAQESGQFTLVLTINSDRISLLIMCFVLYCVCNALRMASEAVEENQSFL